jgi:hypothetical protein
MRHVNIGYHRSNDIPSITCTEQHSAIEDMGVATDDCIKTPEKEPRPAYRAATLLSADKIYWSSILAADMDDDEDGLYDELIG